jgi:hypothetical protein
MIGIGYSICALVVGFGDVPEAFLPSSVPDLEFNALALDLDGLYLEVHPDGGHVAESELLIAVSREDIGLPDSGVA